VKDDILNKVDKSISNKIDEWVDRNTVWIIITEIIVIITAIFWGLITDGFVFIQY